LGEKGQRRGTGKGIDVEVQGGGKERGDGEVRKGQMLEEEEEEEGEEEEVVAERDRATPRRRRDPPIGSCLRTTTRRRRRAEIIWLTGSRCITVKMVKSGAFEHNIRHPTNRRHPLSSSFNSQCFLLNVGHGQSFARKDKCQAIMEDVGEIFSGSGRITT
jgi:hypothetical protein